ncbi:MAG: hypothetical protein ACXACI_14755 [Candidatus Hodarchaeales archaeon]|jgi:hypothetical protein
MKEATRLLLFLIVAIGIGFQIPDLNSTPLVNPRPVAAVDIPTFTTIHPNRSIVWPDETLQLIVHVFTEDQQGIEVGLVSISDLNTSWSQDYSLQAGSGGKLIVSVDIVTITIVGKHVFQASYQGDVPSGYQSSGGMTIVEFLATEPSGIEPCAVDVDVATSTVFTNSSFIVTVNVTASPSAPPFFGGTISISAPAEGLVLTTYIIPSGFYLELSIPVTVEIPIWFSPGLSTLKAEYVDTRGTFVSAAATFEMDILGVGHTLALNVTPLVVNRVDDVITIRVDFAGDNATGKQLVVGWTDEMANWTITTRLVTSNPEVVLWTADYTFSPGPYRIWAELQHPGSGAVYATHDQPVTLFDYVALDRSWNATDVAPGDTIAFSFTSSQQDVPTLAVPSRILITDSEEGLVGNVTTDALGMGSFVWTIPITTAGGNHTLNFTVIPLDANAGLYQQTFLDILAVQARTQIDAQFPAQIQRGQTLVIDYQLSSENQDPVTEGQISFTPPYDSVQIQDVDADGNGAFSLNISLNHPVGEHAFTITYSGTAAYRPANKAVNITILSEPHFSTLYINASPVLPGQTLRIFGQLLDETDTGVASQTIVLYLSGTISLGTTTTQLDGTFAFNWKIPPTVNPGLNVISAEFPGNISAGYLPPLNQPATTAVLISNNIALEVPVIVIANTAVTLKIHGGFGTNASIWWSYNDTGDWVLIVANHSISTIGIPEEIQWNVPSQRGPISFRLTNSLNLTIFANTDVYEEPQYSFPIELVLYVDEEYLLNVSSSASYRILVDGVPVTTWKTTNTTLSISYSLRGLHTITLEIDEEYVVQKTITANVTVYEPVSIIIQAPMNVTENSTALIEITATSGLPGGQPLSGKNVVITFYDLSRDKAIGVFSVFLDSSGTYSLATDPLVWGSYEIQVEFLADQDWFAQTTATTVFYVVGQAQLAFSPPQSIIYNESVILSASLHDNQGPIANKTVSFWWQQSDGTWNALGINITTNSGEVAFLWTPTLEPGNNYNLKAELLGAPDLEAVSVIKPVAIGTRAPEILGVYSLLSNYNDTQIAAPGDYEVVVDIQETSPVDYQVFLTLNGQRIIMTRINGTEYLYQNGTASELLTADGDAFYVGTVTFAANGIYTVTIETEDAVGSKESLTIGSFAVVPPEIQAVWSLLPESKTSTVSLNRPYTVVVQIQEHSPMNYAVFLMVNEQKIPLNQQQGDGYTLQAPNGTTYFIPANESVLYAGILSFPTEGTYDVEIFLEDERGFTQTWEIGPLNASITDDPGQNRESSNNLEANSNEKGLATSVTAETVALLLLMVGSSGAVLFVGRPRRYKV